MRLHKAPAADVAGPCNSWLLHLSIYASPVGVGAATLSCLNQATCLYSVPFMSTDPPAKFRSIGRLLLPIPTA